MYYTLPVLYCTQAGPLYNGQPPYGYRGYVGDLTQRMMGFATLRQVRIKRNTCRVAPEVQNLTRECAQNTGLVNGTSVISNCFDPI